MNPTDIGEREKCMDAGYVKCSHPSALLIPQVCSDENAVLSRTLISPPQRGANKFCLHSTNAAQVTWCIES